jgi:predicted ribosome quality control (RQC) complex YloA/Tae2 family protein
MALSAREIAAVVAELQPIVGSRVEGVRAAGDRAIALELFGRVGPARVLLSAAPDLGRLHAAEARPPRPATPPPFQQLLRKELDGATLASIAAPGDRLVELRFEAPAGPLLLVAELTGRHGNLFLVAADGTIRASAGRNLADRRELVPGKPYTRPEAPGLRVDRVPGSRFAPREGARFPLSAAIEAHYAALEAERAAAEARRRLRDPIRAGIARARRALDKLAEEAARVPAAEEDRRTADLLKGNLHALPRGAREATLVEWTEAGPREVTVRLDPALPPRENMERYYRRYRRIAESAARVAERTAEVTARRDALLALLAELERAEGPALERLEREARRLGAGPRPAPRPRARREEPAPPYRGFRSVAGLAIQVGKGAAENDQLTRAARGNDLWLHARGQKGAHVVVRLDRGRPPDGETLLDAAHLAAWFSDGRAEPQVEVVHTRAKYVKKPKGAAPGAVTYSQEKTILLRMERARIDRLLRDEEA